MKKILKMMLSFLLFLGFIFSSIITPNVYVFADIDNDDLEFQAREIGLTEAKFECISSSMISFFSFLSLSICKLDIFWFFCYH